MPASSADDIARALTEVLVPSPGNRLPIPDVHRAVRDRLDDAVQYKTLKDVLRAAGVRVRAPQHGADHNAYGVALAPGTPDPELELKLRNMRRSTNPDGRNA